MPVSCWPSSSWSSRATRRRSCSRALSAWANSARSSRVRVANESTSERTCRATMIARLPVNRITSTPVPRRMGTAPPWVVSSSPATAPAHVVAAITRRSSESSEATTNNSKNVSATMAAPSGWLARAMNSQRSMVTTGMSSTGSRKK